MIDLSPPPLQRGRNIKYKVMDMSFLGLEIGKATPGYRVKRFAAFIIDAMIILVILYLIFSITGKPDFPAVKAAMDAAQAGAATTNNQALANVMFDLFNTVYWQSLLIWFAYEVLSQMIFSGATPGKLIMKLRIVPLNSKRNWAVNQLLMIARSAMKFASLYIFQGFPFLISALSVFANKESRSGFDIFVKTRVKMIGDTPAEV
jgi:uncharacterized RDD family membrane protein YckC